MFAIAPEFFPVPKDYCDELVRIECASNPHPWRTENLLGSYRHFSHLGAFVDAQLAAFVIYRVVADEAEIIHLVCDAPYQGKGYTHALLHALREKLIAEGVKHLLLEVRENNHRAKHLYAQFGFTTVGRRKNYYGDSSGGRQDALIQRLTIRGA